MGWNCIGSGICICIRTDYINNFKINEEDIEYLRERGGFTEEFLEYKKMKEKEKEAKESLEEKQTIYF